MNIAIQVEQLRKSYGEQLVLKGLTFQVLKGEIFALLGVNGAGKTTALECIEGLRMEAVQLFAKWNRSSIDHSMLTALGINELGGKQYAELSTGQKRRLHLALALLSDPDIVFLDEPTAGLDVEGRLALHDQIRQLKALGKTIVLASHDMAELESLCDRLAILHSGDIAFIGTAEELTSRITHRYSLHIKTDQGTACFEAENIGDTLLTLLENYKQQNITVLDIQIDRGTLEQHFISITKESSE